MIFATVLIILIVVITSFVENLRQNILRKEKQIVTAEERTKDCEKYLSKKVNKSDVYVYRVEQLLNEPGTRL